MARIAGVDLPREKRIEIGLTYVFGIGRAKADKILSMTGINPDTRVRDLTDDEVAKIREAILWKSVVTEVFVTEEVFHVEVRRLRQTLEQEKVLEELLRTRRNN